MKKILLTIMLVLISWQAEAFTAETASVPKLEHLYNITSYKTGVDFGNLKDVYVSNINEVYLVNANTNKVHIFNNAGVAIYDIKINKSKGIPFGVVVNNEGNLFVLIQGKNKNIISVYDFRGVFLNDINFDNIWDKGVVSPRSIAMDKDDNLYVLDVNSQKVLVINKNNELVRNISLANISDAEFKEENFDIFVDNKTKYIYITFAVAAKVCAFDLTGALVKKIGIRGGSKGKLSYPVGAVVDSKENIFVLDSHRHTILIYDKKGNYVNEVGGKGSRNGWFYFPKKITIDKQDRVFILDPFFKRVQILKIK